MQLALDRKLRDALGSFIDAARHVRDVRAPYGTWMIVEPAAGDHVEDNLTPPGAPTGATLPGRTSCRVTISAVPGCAVRRRTAARPPAQPGTAPRAIHPGIACPGMRGVRTG
jgi:hypothetical protein